MKEIVFYDEQCAFCIEVKRLMMKFDKKGQLNFQPLQRYQGAYFSTKDLLRELHVVSENGCIYRGFYAVRQLLSHLTFWKWLTPLFYLPGIPFLGRKIYRLVAKHRGKIMRYLKKYCPFVLY